MNQFVRTVFKVYRPEVQSIQKQVTVCEGHIACQMYWQFIRKIIIQDFCLYRYSLMRVLFRRVEAMLFFFFIISFCPLIWRIHQLKPQKTWFECTSHLLCMYNLSLYIFACILPTCCLFIHFFTRKSWLNQMKPAKWTDKRTLWENQTQGSTTKAFCRIMNIYTTVASYCIYLSSAEFHLVTSATCVIIFPAAFLKSSFKSAFYALWSFQVLFWLSKELDAFSPQVFIYFIILWPIKNVYEKKKPVTLFFANKIQIFGRRSKFICTLAIQPDNFKFILSSSRAPSFGCPDNSRVWLRSKLSKW